MFHRIKYNAEMTKTEKEKQFYSTELFTLNVFDYVKKENGTYVECLFVI